jgi:hypothetical protein
VRIGVHYIAFWCVFGLCGILPLEILDFCGHTRIFLMKAPQQSPSVHHIEHYTFFIQTCQNCVHAQMSTISITAHSHASMSKLRHTICAVNHYTFFYTNMSKLRPCTNVHHINHCTFPCKHDKIASTSKCGSTISTYAIQACQKCVTQFVQSITALLLCKMRP